MVRGYLRNALRCPQTVPGHLNIKNIKMPNHRITEALKEVLGQISSSVLSSNWPKPLMLPLMAKICTFKTFKKWVSCD